MSLISVSRRTFLCTALRLVSVEDDGMVREYVNV